MAELEVGSPAPAFTLTDQHGKQVALSDYRGKRVVVYFYPKADTPGCTMQSCALRDAMPDLKKLNAQVIGISPDTPQSQQAFDEKYDLGFTLLADEAHAVAEAWDAWGESSFGDKTFIGIIRSAFVIDENGKIAATFYKVSPDETVPKVSAALQGEHSWPS